MIINIIITITVSSSSSSSSSSSIIITVISVMSLRQLLRNLNLESGTLVLA